ncbi:uncharacterized protein LOC143450744 isoform X2 [Clavelina lepadiformis]
METLELDLYWTTSYPGETEFSETFGDKWQGGPLDIPSITWFSTPTISEVSKDKFSVLGREIHMSEVHRLMKDATKGNFPINHTTSSEVSLELTIRGEVIFVDQDISFQGLKKIEIYGRRMVSNDKTLNFTAPKVCDEIDGTSCKFFVKAPLGTPGRNGKSGVDSPALNVYLFELVGDLNILTRTSNGTRGQDGDDVNGRIDGSKAGLSGDGGNASEVTISIVKTSGQIVLNQVAGNGGLPAEHGSNYAHGDRVDGFKLYPVPNWGKDDIVKQGEINKVENLKTWFIDDKDLLRIMQRSGESLFLRNFTNKAGDVFAFVKSVTEDNSEINQQVSFLLNAIVQGFDYFGNTEEYAPDLDWSVLQDRVKTLLETGGGNS